MKILIAPDKFKGSLTAQEVSLAIQRGIHRFNPDIETLLLPMADGGDGSLAVLQQYRSLETIEKTVSDPLFRPIQASYQLDRQQAYIEMAAASGLVLLNKSERNCLLTSTLGTGQLIADALQRGAKEIFLFVGGSATNDGGMGVAQALGYRFLDTQKQALPPIGQSLSKVAHVDATQVFVASSQIKITILCDVKNPFYGPQGAAVVYAPQKGAGPAAVEELDQGLRHFNQILIQHGYPDLSQLAGAGAAGGLAGGMFALLKGQLQSGIQFFQSLTQLSTHLKSADLLFTGEGQLDSQTMEGKVVGGVAALARAANVPVIVICGQQRLDSSAAPPFERVYSILDISANLPEAMSQAAEKVEELAERAMEEYFEE